MTDQDILRYANAHLWYLREGDYLPERLQSFNGMRGVQTTELLKEMQVLGTVYPSREVATIISQRVRALLGQASLECLVSRNNNQDNA